MAPCILSLSIMLSRFTQGVVCVDTLVLFIAEYYSTASCVSPILRWILCGVYPTTGGKSSSSLHQLPSTPSTGAPDSFTLFLSGRYLSGFQLSIAKNSGNLGGTFQSMEVHSLPTHGGGVRGGVKFYSSVWLFSQ